MENKLNQEHEELYVDTVFCLNKGIIGTRKKAQLSVPDTSIFLKKTSLYSPGTILKSNKHWLASSVTLFLLSHFLCWYPLGQMESCNFLITNLGENVLPSSLIYTELCLHTTSTWRPHLACHWFASWFLIALLVAIIDR